MADKEDKSGQIAEQRNKQRKTRIVENKKAKQQNIPTLHTHEQVLQVPDNSFQKNEINKQSPKQTNKRVISKKKVIKPKPENILVGFELIFPSIAQNKLPQFLQNENIIDNENDKESQSSVGNCDDFTLKQENNEDSNQTQMIIFQDYFKEIDSITNQFKIQSPTSLFKYDIQKLIDKKIENNKEYVKKDKNDRNNDQEQIQMDTNSIIEQKEAQLEQQIDFPIHQSPQSNSYIIQQNQQINSTSQVNSLIQNNKQQNRQLTQLPSSQSSNISIINNQFNDQCNPNNKLSQTIEDSSTSISFKNDNQQNLIHSPIIEKQYQSYPMQNNIIEFQQQQIIPIKQQSFRNQPQISESFQFNFPISTPFNSHSEYQQQFQQINNNTPDQIHFITPLIVQHESPIQLMYNDSYHTNQQIESPDPQREIESPPSMCIRRNEKIIQPQNNKITLRDNNNDQQTYDNKQEILNENYKQIKTKNEKDQVFNQMHKDQILNFKHQNINISQQIIPNSVSSAFISHHNIQDQIQSLPTNNPFQQSHSCLNSNSKSNSVQVHSPSNCIQFNQTFQLIPISSIQSSQSSASSIQLIIPSIILIQSYFRGFLVRKSIHKLYPLFHAFNLECFYQKLEILLQRNENNDQSNQNNFSKIDNQQIEELTQKNETGALNQLNQSNDVKNVQNLLLNQIDKSFSQQFPLFPRIKILHLFFTFWKQNVLMLRKRIRQNIRTNWLLHGFRCPEIPLKLHLVKIAQQMKEGNMETLLQKNSCIFDEYYEINWQDIRQIIGSYEMADMFHKIKLTHSCFQIWASNVVKVRTRFALGLTLNEEKYNKQEIQMKIGMKQKLMNEIQKREKEKMEQKEVEKERNLIMGRIKQEQENRMKEIEKQILIEKMKEIQLFNLEKERQQQRIEKEIQINSEIEQIKIKQIEDEKQKQLEEELRQEEINEQELLTKIASKRIKLMPVRKFRNKSTNFN